MKLSRHAITVLTRQYKSVLLKCALINAGLFLAVAPAMAVDAQFTIKTDGSTVVTPGDADTTINLNNVNTAISTVGDSTTGLVKDVADLQGVVGDSTTGLVKDVADLQGVVGDSTTGLVKDVSDNANAISALETTVGDSTSGLVKDVSDLQTTVGDSTSGLVKDVATNTSDISSLKTTVGDSTSGLVKDVATNTSDISSLKTTVGDSTSGLVKGVNDLKTAVGTTSISGIGDGTITGAISSLDTRVTTAEGEITKLTTGTDTGVLSVLEAHIGDNGLASAGVIKTTGTANIEAAGNLIAAGNISTTNGTISGKNGSFTGDLGVTGKSTTGSLEVTNNAEVKGNATITGTLSAGATTVKGTFGAGTGGSMFIVDADGDITKAGTIAATGLTTTTSATTLGGSGYTNTITGATNIINGVTQLDAANGMKFGAGGSVAKDIDNGSAARTKTTANNDTTLATVASVLKSAENADFTVGSTTNIGATNNTLGKAITALDGAIGDRSNIGSANTAINNGTKTSVAAGLKAAGDAIGSQTYSNSATVNYGVIAANTDLTTAVSQVASNIGAALTTVADRDASFKLNAGNSVNANLAKLDATIGASVTTTTNGIAATNTVNANIDALNTAMGDVSTVSVNGYNTVVDLVGAVNQLDANMNAVLGGVYKASDGLYDQTAIKGTNGFDNKATSSNLTAALKSYADNVVAATGVAYNPDGSVATTYTKATTTDYDGLNANSSLKAAIEQLDGNIGTAITGTTRTATGATTSATASVNDNIKAIDAYLGGDVTAVARTNNPLVASNTVKANLEALDKAIGTDAELLTTTVSTASGDNNGVKVANSVNRNIAALNAAVGDVSTLSKGKGATGDAITNGTGTAAATVVEALNNIDATIGNIHGLYDGSKVNSSTVTSTVNGHSNLAVGTTVEDHLVSLDNAIGDRSFASTHYVAPHDDLSTAVTKLDSELHSVNHKVRELRHDMNRGLASVAALSALVPNARGTGNTSLSVGTGHYHGQTAMALGGAHWFTDNLMVNIGVASTMGHTRDATYRAGVSYSF